MSTYRVFQFVTFLSALAISLSAFLASAANACGVTGSGGFC
ncbi:MAG TPA: hypothetical protein VK732_08310 [Verrucomicrobiae bacterium]|nr:hypothetical protein [Verrucomicrobiae bacterium]